MQQLIEDPELTKRLSKGAAATAEQYSWQKTVDLVQLAYERIIKQKGNTEQSTLSIK